MKKNKKIWLVIVVLMVASYFFWTIVFPIPYEIRGISMSPNYVDGQFYLSERISPNLSLLKRGDVIVYEDPSGSTKRFIKRVIGIPKDTIMIKNGDLYLNGEKQVESYTNGTKTYGGKFLKDEDIVTVPDQTVFVLGDNRLHSSDSRVTGFIPDKLIKGKIFLCYNNCTQSK